MGEPDRPALSPTPLDDRENPPMMAGERSSLESWLEMYRTALLVKVGGLSAEQLCTASVPHRT